MPIKIPTPLDIHESHSEIGEHVKRISEYKGRLDAALVAKMKRKATPAQVQWLDAEGFTLESPTGTGVSPDTFARWVFGPFSKPTTGNARVVVTSFPGYYAIGWNRRQYARVEKSEAEEIKRQLDQDSMNTDEGDGHAKWLQPLPAVVAGEGKHRVDLFREHELTMVAKVTASPIPSASDLELCKVWGADDIWALRCKNPDFRRGRRNNGEFAPLPLPDLSVPIFKAYGVQVRKLPCFPWKVTSEELGNLQIFDRLDASLWRSHILTSGYV
jgi:hypothetical protein